MNVHAERDTLTDARKLVKSWPRWLRVIAFVGLAVAAALAGTLDDWVRVLLAVMFAALALTFLAEAIESLRGERSGVADSPPPPTTYPTGQAEVPEPDDAR